MKTIQVRNILIGEGIPKICVPLIGKNRVELMREAVAITSASVDIVEWRMDWFEEITDVKAVREMLYTLRCTLGDIPLLTTFRSKEEGGERTIKPAYYIRLNNMISDSGYADLIDIELYFGHKEMIKSMVAYAHSKKIFVVMSNHDFIKTPAYEVILERLCRMQELGADIPKIAVMPTCKKDVLTLLHATNTMYEQYANGPIITMSMANIGIVSRLCGEIFGSALTFGSVSKASAPGQMAVEDLKSILSLLHNNL